MKRSVLFVCLGNICRSPAAEEIFRSKVSDMGLENEFDIDSAGTYRGHNGALPDIRMSEAALSRGYRLHHHARPIEESDFYHFDRIIVMDDMNYETVSRLAPERKYIDKLFRMREFLSSFSEDWSYVPDPYHEGRKGFELVLDMLEEGCANLLSDMLER